MKIQTGMTRTAAAICAALIASTAVLAQQMRYPDTRKSDQVDTYHGVRVADPYRWLEDDTSAETAAWVEAREQGHLRLSRRDSLPGRSSRRG